MDPSPAPNPSRKPSKDNKGNFYLQYSGMVFEMLAIIGIFSASGYFIDQKLELGFPIATILLSLVGLGLAFYRIFKQAGNT